jgi:hypothetical protein
MSSDDDAEARRKRAAKLREQIDRITRSKRVEVEAPEGTDAGEERSVPSPSDKRSDDETARRPAPGVRRVSPREFIERRMREFRDSRDKGKGNRR